jgi:hypothetical protein
MSSPEKEQAKRKPLQAVSGGEFFSEGESKKSSKYWSKI